MTHASGAANWSTWELYNMTAGCNEAAYSRIMDLAIAYEDDEIGWNEYIDEVQEFCENDPMLEKARASINEEGQNDPDEGMDMIDWDEFVRDFLDQ